MAGPHREPANVKRDAHRHPLETFTLLGFTLESHVDGSWPRLVQRNL